MMTRLRFFPSRVVRSPYFYLSIVLLFVTIVRWRLLDVPLERDEGEYAYMAQLFLEGTPLYAEAYSMKFPGIYFSYALVMALFGQTAVGIHTGLLFCNATAIVLLFWLGRLVVDEWIGFFTASMYAVLTLSYHVDGFSANAEHFVLPFGLGGLIALIYGLRNEKSCQSFLSGVLLASAMLVKQHGLVFGLTGLVVLVSKLSKNPANPPRLRLVAFWAAGAIVPMLLVFVYLLASGVMDRFIFWTYSYALEYGSQVSVREVPQNFLGAFIPLVKPTRLIWLLVLLGLGSLFLFEPARKHWLFATSFTFCSLLATTPGFYFRTHYLVLFLPAAALLGGLGARWLFFIFSSAQSSFLRLAPPMIVTLLALVTSVTSHSDVLFIYSPEKVARTTFGGNPFPESSIISGFVRQHTSVSDKIAIIGSEPQIFFRSHRRSATGYIYMYPLLEEQKYALSMQQEMTHQIEEAKPKLLLYYNVQPSLPKRQSAPDHMFNWFARYASENYRLIARLEYTPGASTTLLLTDEKRLKEDPRQVYWVSFLERKAD